MPIPDGCLRLHWTDKEAINRYQDHPCLDDALNHAAMLYMKDEGWLTRLENQWREDACPPDQLVAVAKMRTKAALQAHDARISQEALEATPGWGTF